MLLIRLSGHSGAGKSRLLTALTKSHIVFKKTILYTTRAPRKGEKNGKDYYFITKKELKRKKSNLFLISKVHDTLQAIDLEKLKNDLFSGYPVIIEVFHTFWHRIESSIREISKIEPGIISVFLTAINIDFLKSLSIKEMKKKVREEIIKILNWRNHNNSGEIRIRAHSAIKEISAILNGNEKYDHIINSAPEGPDGKDEWTKGNTPEGLAGEAFNRFISILRGGSC